MRYIRIDLLSAILGIAIFFSVRALKYVHEKKGTVSFYPKLLFSLRTKSLICYSGILNIFAQERLNFYFFLAVLGEAVLRRTLLLAFVSYPSQTSEVQRIYDLFTAVNIKIGVFLVSFLVFWSLFMAIRDLSLTKSMVLGGNWYSRCLLFRNKSAKSPIVSRLAAVLNFSHCEQGLYIPSVYLVDLLLHYLSEISWITSRRRIQETSPFLWLIVSHCS